MVGGPRPGWRPGTRSKRGLLHGSNAAVRRPARSPLARQERPRHASGDDRGAVGSNAVAGVARSQVSWRFASWRVAAMPRRAKRRRVDRAVEKLPRLPVADAAHRRQRPASARSARAAPRSSSTRPAASIASKRCAIAACSARAVRRHERDRDRRPERRRRLRARPAAPTAAARRARSTSSARWMRCASVGSSRAAVDGIDARELGVQRRPAFARGARVESRAHGRDRPRGSARQALGRAP